MLNHLSYDMIIIEYIIIIWEELKFLDFINLCAIIAEKINNHLALDKKIELAILI